MLDLGQRQQLTPSMRQEQTITHQQIQALEMLAKPALELQGMVATELEKNPLLEAEAAENDTVDVAEEEAWLEAVLRLDEQSSQSRSKTLSMSPEEQERRQRYMDSIAAPETPHDGLISQLQFLDLAPELRSACEMVLSGLNDDGYLESHPADLAMVCGLAMDVITRAIEIVQGLEPAGIAARDLRERLLLQLERKGRQDSLAYAVIRDCMDEMAGNQLPTVARKMRVPMPELREAIDEIQELRPRLHMEDYRPMEYVREEAVVMEDSGELRVNMKSDYLPRLFINPQYKKLLMDPNTPQETRDYIKERIRSATFLINSLSQRQSTLARIVGAIVEDQADFFRNGINHMKPLTMSQVAEQIGVYETTVSRAVAGKHLRCRFGLLPLKTFFSTSCELQNGGVVSNVVVKSVIRQLVKEENRKKPLSDGQIAEKLAGLGYKVARRTVAKYREQLGILSSKLRQKYWNVAA